MKDEGLGPEGLRERTKRYALSMIALVARLPRGPEAAVIGRQVLRSGTSVGAHYREACRARSNAEFISKMEGGLQELEETDYWLELLTESRLHAEQDAFDLIVESRELIAIFVTIVKKRKEQR